MCSNEQLFWPGRLVWGADGVHRREEKGSLCCRDDESIQALDPPLVYGRGSSDADHRANGVIRHATQFQSFA